jgi:hypothetical protein
LINIEKSSWVNPYDEENIGILIGIGNFVEEVKGMSCDEISDSLKFQDKLIGALQSEFEYREDLAFPENDDSLKEMFVVILQKIFDKEKIIKELGKSEEKIDKDKKIAYQDKQILLYNLSVMRLYLTAYAYACPNWDDLWDDCMRNKIRDCYSNPVCVAYCMSGGGGHCVLQWMFECMYEASAANCQ